MTPTRCAILAISLLFLAATAAPAAEPRYVAQGDGTVLDTITGLLWLQKAGCLGEATQSDAETAVAQLAEGTCGLADGSLPGSWRLPTEKEWNAVLKKGCKPAISDDQGSGCLRTQTSFSGVEPRDYWSSTPDPDDPETLRVAQLAVGLVICPNRERNAIWPVRSAG